MEFVISTLKLIMFIALFFLIDYLLNQAVGCIFAWLVGFSAIWYIILTALVSLLLVFFISMVAMMANYVVFINKFKTVATTLICFYLIITCILMKINSYRWFNFENTKQAIVGAGSILYFLAKTSYGCRSAWLARKDINLWIQF